MEPRPKHTRKQKREIAQQLYLHSDKSQKEIAELVGVTEKSLSKWKSEGKWDEIKQARSLGKEQLISELYIAAGEIRQAAKDEDRPLSAKEVDQISKIAASIEKLDKSVGLSTTISVFEQFTKYLMGRDPELARKLADHMSGYIHILAAGD